jgi:hypothetical protein
MLFENWQTTRHKKRFSETIQLHGTGVRPEQPCMYDDKTFPRTTCMYIKYWFLILSKYAHFVHIIHCTHT